MKFFAGFEADRFARSDADLGSRSRVAADTGLAGLHGKDAKASEFDSLAGYEGPFHALEDRVDGQLGLGSRQTGTLYDPLNEVLLDHDGSTFPDSLLAGLLLAGLLLAGSLRILN